MGGMKRITLFGYIEMALLVTAITAWCPVVKEIGNSGNVVGSLLAGAWEVDDALCTRLGTRADYVRRLRFILEQGAVPDEVLARLPESFHFTVYTMRPSVRQSVRSS